MPALYTDNFNRANEAPLAAPWIRITGKSYDARLVSNVATTYTTGGAAVGMYYPSPLNNDQYCICKVKSTVNTAIVGPIVRCEGTANTYYTYLNDGGNKVNNFLCRKYVNGGITQLGSAQTITYTDWIPVKLSVAGIILSLEVNGADQGTRTDVSLTSGYAGFQLTYPGGSGSSSVDDWEAGNMPTRVYSPIFSWRPDLG